MYELKILARIRPEKGLEFMQTLDVLLAEHKEGEAPRQGGVYVSVRDPTEFLVCKHWPTIALAKQYCRSPLFRSLLGATEVLGDLTEINLMQILEGAECPLDLPNL